MDDFFDKKKRSDVDLTSFDLTQFKKYFDEEDAQRLAKLKESIKPKTEEEENKENKEDKPQAEKNDEIKADSQAEEEESRDSEPVKEEKSQEEKDAERIRIEQEKLRKKIAEAKKLAQDKAAEQKVSPEERKKEEAHRAAEKTAAAVLAAKKAEEAKIKEQQEISARLLEQADVDNSSDLGSVSEKDKKNEELDFAEVSSILDIKNKKEQSNDIAHKYVDTEEDDEDDFIENSSSELNEKKKSIIFTILCVVLGVATVVCAGLAVLNFLKGAENSDANSSDANTQDIRSYNPYSDLKINYNNATYPNAINPKLKAMYSENNDIVGWLTINGTAIDYPIMQDNNNKYYLYNHNAYNESARYGTPFLDFRCNKFNLSKNTIVYGHHMNNNAHFGSLDGYADPEYFKKHPIIRYDTLTASYSFKVYAAFYATTQSSVDGGYVFDYYNPNMSSSNFKGYIQMLNQYALYTTEAGLRENDKIITLSTCTHVYDNLKKGGVDARLVVVGRLLRSGESENMNTDNVLVNSDYRRPQLWYDKKGKTNPYAAYRSWQPSTR